MQGTIMLKISSGVGKTVAVRKVQFGRVHGVAVVVLSCGNQHLKLCWTPYATPQRYKSGIMVLSVMIEVSGVGKQSGISIIELGTVHRLAVVVHTRGDEDRGMRAISNPASLICVHRGGSMESAVMLQIAG